VTYEFSCIVINGNGGNTVEQCNGRLLVAAAEWLTLQSPLWNWNIA